jgi:hypothetical protein
MGMDQNTHCNVASIIEERYAMLGEVRNSLKESQENLLHLRDMLADFDQFNSVGRAFWRIAPNRMMCRH